MGVRDPGPEVAVLSTTVQTEPSAHVDWRAIIAGAVIASAVSFLLFTFGTGIGLSLTSPYPAETVSASVFAIILGLWIVLVTVMSFLLGGYFTGLLMRRRAASEHETEMRDGMHGALAWALGVLLGASITAFTLAGTARTATEAGAAAVQAAAGSDMPATYYADSLLRSDNPAAVAPAETEARRGEIIRIFLHSPTGDLTDSDKTYLGQLVTRQSGLAQPEAAARVDAVIGEYKAAITAAQEAAEKARKFALFLAFAVAASLAVGAGAAWWGAVQGGEHRDQNSDLTSHIGWKRLRGVRS